MSMTVAEQRAQILQLFTLLEFDARNARESICKFWEMAPAVVKPTVEVSFDTRLVNGHPPTLPPKAPNERLATVKALDERWRRSVDNLAPLVNRLLAAFQNEPVPDAGE